MQSMLMLVVTSLLAMMLVRLATALSSGAPSLACINMRPIHGLHQARPASASQFFVRQSALGYAPGVNITVEIMTQSNERHFRGFMVQSYDPIDGKQIGKFAANNEAKPMACAAATHRNNQDKTRVSITWVSPETESNTSDKDNESRPPPGLGVLGSWLGLPMNAIQKRHLPTAAPVQTTPLRQVRFRATIVVSYSEFYSGFESSERNFESFDYSPAALSQTRRGLGDVAAAVSPKANTTARAATGNN